MAGTRVSGGGTFDKSADGDDQGGEDKAKVLGSMLDQMKPLPMASMGGGKTSKRKRGKANTASGSESDTAPEPKEKEKKARSSISRVSVYLPMFFDGRKKQWSKSRRRRWTKNSKRSSLCYLSTFNLYTF